MKYSVCLLGALIALLPAAASAQFTTFVAPPKRTDSLKPPVAAAPVRTQSDAAARVALTNMKVWVDSAAGVGAQAPSMIPAPEAPPSTQLPTVGALKPRKVTTTFSNGAVAPETASSLPLIALVGIAALSIGTVMLAGRDRA